MSLDQLKLLQGTGRSVSVTSGVATADTVAMGAQTYACQLSLTGTGPAVITISNNASLAATATKDMLIKVSDFPIRVACAPGDKISAYGVGATSTLYIVELG